MKIKYDVTARMAELRKSIDSVVEANDALLVELQVPTCPEGDHKRQLVKENIEKIRSLKEMLSLEEAQEKERAWSQKSQVEPTRPEGTAEATDERTTPKAERFARFGDYLQAVVRAGSPGGQMDRRLRLGGDETRDISGASTVIPSEGGFLVQPEDGGILLRDVYASGSLFTRCKKMRLSAGSSGMRLKLIDEASRADGYRHGGVRVYQASEGDTVTASKLKFREFKLDLEKTMGLSYMTNELMRNAAALETYVRDAFVKEIAFHVNKLVIDGTGVGQALGIKNSASLVSVAKEGSQTATTINVMNVLKMWSRLWNPGVANAIWIVGQDSLPQLFSLNSDPAVTKLGYPLFMPPGPLNAPLAGAPLSNGFLLGSPLVRSEFCETIGTKGDLMYLDLGEYLIIDKEDTVIDSSIHFRFIYDEMTLRVRYEWNGSPLWNLPMTPYKGSSTVGPFVALDTRS